MASVEILGFAPSTYTRVARMACEEKGVPYELKPLPPHASEVAAIHPFGKIPALRHGDFELCESKAIADYVDRSFNGPALFPSDARERALAEQWVSIVNTVMDPLLVRTYIFAYFFPKTADGSPDRAAIDAAAPKLREQIAILDKAVAPTGYLAGDRYSFADINLMAILFYVKALPEGAAATPTRNRCRLTMSATRSGPASRTPFHRRPTSEGNTMTAHPIVAHEEWLAARQRLLAEEKAFTQARDRLSAARRELPWERVEDYAFAGSQGEVKLSALFRGRSQLIVYHLMFHPDWNAACKSCSFWADNFERAIVHLNARDTNLAAVSRAPIGKLDAFKKRMGWSFEWVSCGPAGSFNRDLGVNFTPDETKTTDKNYNYGTIHFGIEDAPGLSVFAQDETGALFHTYSTYSRGLDMLNGAYHYLDIVPKGRGEDGMSYPMSWVRLHDEYAPS